MSGNGKVLLVYMTASSEAEARMLAEMLVDQQAAACVNVLGPIQSVYRWQGSVEKSEEVALIAKTTDLAFPRLEHLIKERHSYDCPCIIAIPVDCGHLPFLEWVRGAVVYD